MKFIVITFSFSDKVINKVIPNSRMYMDGCWLLNVMMEAFCGLTCLRWVCIWSGVATRLHARWWWSGDGTYMGYVQWVVV